jgi:hypothetical protein
MARTSTRARQIERIGPIRCSRGGWRWGDTRPTIAACDQENGTHAHCNDGANRLKRRSSPQKTQTTAKPRTNVLRRSLVIRKSVRGNAVDEAEDAVLTVTCNFTLLLAAS